MAAERAGPLLSIQRMAGVIELLNERAAQAQSLRRHLVGQASGTPHLKPVRGPDAAEGIEDAGSGIGVRDGPRPLASEIRPYGIVARTKKAGVRTAQEPEVRPGIQPDLTQFG